MADIEVAARQRVLAGLAHCYRRIVGGTGAPPNMAKARPLNMRVLVIDDDETVCAGMFHLLRDWGCECDAASSIEEALELASIQVPDLVISDYRLREQRTGLEAIGSLRALLGNNLSALLITGDTAPDRLREAQTSGIRIRHKPVSPSQLYRGLVTVLEQTEKLETD